MQNEFRFAESNDIELKLNPPVLRWLENMSERNSLRLVSPQLTFFMSVHSCDVGITVAYIFMFFISFFVFFLEVYL